MPLLRMSKGKPARLGLIIGSAIGDNAAVCEFIAKHSIDFYVTNFWNGQLGHAIVFCRLFVFFSSL